jgi:hypothetical protein
MLEQQEIVGDRMEVMAPVEIVVEIVDAQVVGVGVLAAVGVEMFVAAYEPDE